MHKVYHHYIWINPPDHLAQVHKAVLILWEIRVCWTSRGSCAPGSDDGGGGRRAINDGIEGKGGYLHNDWGKRIFGELPKNRSGFGAGV